jgi:hypothetical protein
VRHRQHRLKPVHFAVLVQATFGLIFRRLS